MRRLNDVEGARKEPEETKLWTGSLPVTAVTREEMEEMRTLSLNEEGPCHRPLHLAKLEGETTLVRQNKSPGEEPPKVTLQRPAKGPSAQLCDLHQRPSTCISVHIIGRTQHWPKWNR